MSRVDSVRLAVEKSPRRVAAGRGAGLRRVLPVRRRPGAGDRGRRHGDRPAGRLQARRRGRRRRRRGRHRDGLHRAAGTSAIEHRAPRLGRPVGARRGLQPRGPRGSLVLVAGCTAVTPRTGPSPGWATPTRRRARRWTTSRPRSSRRGPRSQDVVRTRLYVTDISALGGGRPGPRRGLRRDPAGHGDGRRSPRSWTRGCWSRSRPRPTRPSAPEAISALAP